MKVNSEKCYLLGLLIGGGVIKSNHLQIILPYKKWGDLKENPRRGGSIAEDILKRAKPLWKQHYKLDVSYKIDGEWKIISDLISAELSSDLIALKLENSGEFRENADISTLMPLLRNNDEFARSFISGLVDTVGSLAQTHRRFTSKFQIVSLEFKGRNFGLVGFVTELLTQINCLPDQVLWNHPNQHSGQDRYYKSWKKGFKIRVALDDYFLRGSFVFEAKQLSAAENKKLQKDVVNTVVGKISKLEGRTALHSDENTNWLPSAVRGYHFIHYTHLASFLGIAFPNAIVDKNTPFEKYVCPFTLLTKGTKEEIESIIETEDYLKQSTYAYYGVDLQDLLQAFAKDKNLLLFGNSEKDGFPVNLILQGIAYVYCATENYNIMGKRVLGSYVDLLHECQDNIQDLQIGIPDRGTCLLITNGEYSAIVGYCNDEFNKGLLTVNGIKVQLRSPVYSECIRLK